MAVCSLLLSVCQNGVRGRFASRSAPFNHPRICSHFGCCTEREGQLCLLACWLACLFACSPCALLLSLFLLLLLLPWCVLLLPRQRQQVFGKRRSSEEETAAFFLAVVVVRPKVYITSLSIAGARRNFSPLHSLHLDSLFVLNCILRLYDE